MEYQGCICAYELCGTRFGRVESQRDGLVTDHKERLVGVGGGASAVGEVGFCASVAVTASGLSI